MCDHKYKLTENDKKFLFSLRIKPHVCHICERLAIKVTKRLRVEEKPDVSHDDDEAKPE